MLQVSASISILRHLHKLFICKAKNIVDCNYQVRNALAHQTRCNLLCALIHTSRYRLDQKHEANEVVHISEGCVKKMKKVADVKQEFLRVEVEGGGCSGFQYKFQLTDSIRQDDRVFEKDGVKVLVDEESLQLLKGSTVDYEEELIKSSFRVVDNPQAEAGCSCGASFAIGFDSLTKSDK